MQKSSPITGGVAVVTGGAQGIGRETARVLAGRGFTVIVADLALDLAQQTAAELAGDAEGVLLDVAEPGGFDRVFDAVEDAHGPVSVLVNNAGICPLGSFVEEDDAVADRQIDVNLRGTLMGTKAAARRMLPRGQGHIVNVASIAGVIQIPHLATYCATKAAILALSASVRAELLGSGVNVSVVAPTGVDTQLSRGVKDRPGARKAQPEDVAEAIATVIAKPRAVTYVPTSIGVVGWVHRALPQAARDMFLRASGGNDLGTMVDQDARIEYEREIAALAQAGKRPLNRD